jgi:hypothetical protein
MLKRKVPMRPNNSLTIYVVVAIYQLVLFLLGSIDCGFEFAIVADDQKAAV